LSTSSPQASEFDKLKAIAASQLSSATTPEAIEAAGRIMAQVIEIEKHAAEIDKVHSESKKLEWDMSTENRRTRSGERKHLATLLAPLLTTIVLAGTLVLQTYQAVTSERDKQVEQARQRDAAEDIRWADTIKLLSGEIRGISPGALSLINFFASPRYADLARQTAVNVLLQTKDFQQFKQLFNAAYPNLSWSNLNGVLALDRQLVSRNSEVTVKANRPGAILTQDEQAAFSLYSDSLDYLCAQIAAVLRSPRPPGFQLDMSYVAVGVCDMSQANFSYANLNGFNPTAIILRGADFAGATGYETAAWADNVWWHADKIDKDMLAYLVKNEPFDPKRNYWSVKVSQQDYDAEVHRLSR